MARTSSFIDHQFHIRDAGGRYQVASPDQILEAARELIDQRLQRGLKMCSPEVASDYVTIKLGVLDHEIFAVLFLDTQHDLIEYVEMFRGTVDGSAVYPREVVKEALARNAAAVIFVHNHPSGSLEPSTADRNITDQLREALRLFDIRVLDHLIVAGGKVNAFSKLGLL
jgi:DNA repair protein RadC